MFGRTAERKARARADRASTKRWSTNCSAALAPHNHALAVELASIPEHIRGYGHVKERQIADAKAREAALLDRFRSAPASIAAPKASPVAAD